MTPGNEVRFAMMGCGAIAHKHIAALARIPGARVVGLYDVEPAAAAALGQKYALPVYGDMRQLVERERPDFINILTPSGMHAANLLELLDSGCHFVVEKPLALRLSEIDDILLETSQRNLRVHVVKQNRFNPPIQKLKEALDAGRFGKLVMGTVRLRWMRTQAYYDQRPWRGTWAMDGGVFTNQASHHIDALLWMMGEPESVMAKICTRLVKIETEDTGAAIIRFRSGALGVIEATTATRPKDLEGSLSILGEHGSVEVGGFAMSDLKTWNFSRPHPMDDDVWASHCRVPDEPAWNHTAYFKDLIDCHLAGRHGLVDGLEGRKSIELINAIYESAESGQEVALRFRPRISRLGVAA